MSYFKKEIEQINSNLKQEIQKQRLNLIFEESASVVEFLEKVEITDIELFEGNYKVYFKTDDGQWSILFNDDSESYFEEKYGVEYTEEITTLVCILEELDLSCFNVEKTKIKDRADALRMKMIDKKVTGFEVVGNHIEIIIDGHMHLKIK